MSSARGDRSIHEPFGPNPHDEHEIVYAKCNDGAVPGREFLNNCPDKIRDKFRAVLIAVAKAPPHRFSGGGYWEAMKGEMRGFHEVRVDGPRRQHYRVFCLVDARAEGAKKPYLVIIDGRTKPFRTTLKKSDYRAIRELGDEYMSRNPRQIS